MSEARGLIKIGISSWADASLIESHAFYPPEIKTAAERLRYYSGIFPIAEIDSSFHFFPTQRNLELWLDNTPARFTFHMKVFSLFTQHPTSLSAIPRTLRSRIEEKPGNVYLHQLPQDVADSLWQAFADDIRSFETAGKLGFILFQFPPWFHFSEDNLEYLAKCKVKLPQYRLAVEFRTADWLNENNRETTITFLRKHGLTLVCVDEPQGTKSTVPPLTSVTSDTGYVRFHGRNAANWEKKGIQAEDRFNYLYNEDELKEWVPKIQLMAQEAKEVHVIFKNKTNDFPIRNALQMRQLLGLSTA
jgi:uncharacterized protein YecE (DUF72 family)